MQNFTQYQFAHNIGYQMILISIRGSLLEQLQDAIHPVAHEVQVAVANKVAMVLQNSNRITHVNGSRVYNVKVDSERGDIWFSLSPASQPRHYYPIQYARIAIAVETQMVLM